jgi:predicted lipoprotein with Yx(FWY)xxD motif
MKTTILLLGATVAAVGALTACGGTNGGATNPPPPPPSASPPAAVSVKDVSGVGQALVDASGKTLYFADQEAGGMIKCLSGCLSIWVPATGTAADAKSVSGLATMKRSDTGAEQLTFQGKPLYTFKFDNNGQAKGNNVTDNFSGAGFTWHAATTSAAAAPSPAPSSSSGGGGYGNGY